MDVTGGVYKAREHIHRSMADLRVTSNSSFMQAGCSLQSVDRLFEISSASRLGNPLYRPL